MSPFILGLWLALGPAEQSFGAGVEQLEQALVSAEPTSESAAALEESLRGLEAHALELAGDSEACELLDRARLALVSVYVALGEDGQAEAAMDEAIRSAMGRPVAAGSFGPEVLTLYESRVQALEDAGRARIAIECEGCRVIANEAALDDGGEGLYLGHYRVWASSGDAGVAPVRYDIELSEAGSVERRSFGVPTEGADPRSADEVHDEPLVSVTPRARVLPRWSELLGLSAGAGLLITGVILAGLHDKCRGNPSHGDPLDPDACPDIYANHPQDQVLIALGAGVLVTAGVVLTVDEVRVGRARGRQAMLTWTMQF